MLADDAPASRPAVAARLRAAGCVYAEDEADLLIAAARTPAELTALVSRRAAGQPLEHVLGWAEFRGLRISVDPGVFVPRRRTEFLAGQAIALARPGAVVVDLCCGSGALGAALAGAVAGAQVHAADIDPAAVRCARRNLAAAGRVYQGDLYGPLPAALRGRVDILLANVPYVPAGEVALLPPEARDYEARAALDGGPDGLGVLRRVTAGAPAWLAPGGHLLSEISERQVAAATAAATAAGLAARVDRSGARRHGPGRHPAGRPGPAPADPSRGGPGAGRAGGRVTRMDLDTLPRQLARTRRFSLGHPSRATVSPDGGTVFFLRSRAGDDPVSCLWAVDCASGAERLLADPVRLLAGAAEQLPDEELTRRERTREMSGGIVGYAADDACGLLAFALSGQLWVARPADGSVRRLAAAGPVTDPRPDPAGRGIAYLSGGALRVISADGAADRVIAAPEEPAVSYGRAEHVAAESMGRYRGYWWAPDGQRLLVARVDEAPVQQWYRADPAEPGQPPAAFRYPPAGSANALVSLWIASVTGAPTVPLTAVDWDSAALEYLTAAGWDGSGPFAAVQRRDQRHVQVLGIDAATGATRVLAGQHDDAWVQLVPGLPARTSSGTLLTSADSADTRRLLVGGQPVTPPGLQLDEVLAVDGETVLFTASDEPDADPCVGLRPRGRAAPPEHGTGSAPRDRAGGHGRPGLPHPGPPRPPDHRPPDPRHRRGPGGDADHLGG